MVTRKTAGVFLDDKVWMSWITLKLWTLTGKSTSPGSWKGRTWEVLPACRKPRHSKSVKLQMQITKERNHWNTAERHAATCLSVWVNLPEWPPSLHVTGCYGDRQNWEIAEGYPHTYSPALRTHMLRYKERVHPKSNYLHLNRELACFYSTTIRKYELFVAVGGLFKLISVCMYCHVFLLPWYGWS